LDNDIRLYLDENVEIEIALQLKQRGIEVVSVRELDMLGDSDENHLARATRMGYVLCTYDQDYLRLNAQGIAHAGIVFAHRSRTNIGVWVRGLVLLCEIYASQDMQNHVEYLSSL
jgi:hypothetical protein